MMRIPAVIGVMSAALVFLSTGEQNVERLRERTSSAATAAQRTADRAFAVQRNAEINQSIAWVEAVRSIEFTRVRNAEIIASLATVAAARSADLVVAARNAEIETSMAAAEARRLAEFTKARNQEIANSIAAVAAQHALLAFAEARNAEITKSLAAVEALRMVRFAQERNAEIAGSLIAVEGQRKLAAFAEAQNAQAQRSIAAVETVRLAEFAAARNDEIRTAMRAAELRRTYAVAMAKPAAASVRLETGSIEGKSAVETKGVLPAGAATLGAQACQEMINDLGPIYWARKTAALSDRTRHHLDELATIAKRCVSMVIEVHGHADAAGSPDTSKRLSEQRARAVADYLIRLGVEAHRVVAIGHGADSPIVTGDAQESMTCNRRIEFSLQGSQGGPKLSEILRDLR